MRYINGLLKKDHKVIQISIYLEVWPGWNNVAIFTICNHLFEIYYAFKKESRYIVVVKKEKDAIGDKNKICAYSNISGKSAQNNQ